MTNLKLIGAIIFSLLLLGYSSLSASAEIIIDVSDNGSSTQNTVQVNQVADTSVSQSNDAQNDVNVEEHTNTGENSISASNDQASITTGNSESTTTIENNLNSQVAVSSCCPSTATEVVVSKNGTDSINTVSVNTHTSTVISVIQVSEVKNHLNTYANTGANTISQTTGNSAIHTGSIIDKTDIVSKMNTTYIKWGIYDPSVSVFVFGNGSGSVNTIETSLLNELVLLKYETAFVKNDISQKLSTGDNKIKDSLGDVKIITGDIVNNTKIVNGPINDNIIIINSCEDVTNPPGDGGGNGGDNPAPPGNGGSTTGNGGSQPGTTSSNDTSSSIAASSFIGGQILGSFVDILPATGATALRFWTLAVIYLLMFLLGLYVRLRAGRSPDFAYSRTYTF